MASKPKMRGKRPERSEGKLVYYTLSDTFLVALLHACTCHVQGKDRAR